MRPVIGLFWANKLDEVSNVFCQPLMRWDPTANLRTNIMDFRGFDSSIILILRGGIPRPIGDFPESLSQAMLVGVMLVGGLGVGNKLSKHIP